MSLIALYENEIVSSDGGAAFDSIQEAILANSPLYVSAPYYVELLGKKSALLAQLETRRASILFPLKQNSSFITFTKLLKERNWTNNGVLRMKRSKTDASQSEKSHLVSDLYMIQHSISPISRISGVSISHETSNTSHSIFTIRFSTNAIGHYEHLSSPHVSEGLDLEWSGKEGILEYESEHAQTFKENRNKRYMKKRYLIDRAVEITPLLKEELQKLTTWVDLNIKHEVRR
ncbi:hypothetical protein ABID52_000527 [Fictibacillus halophilus]|uniref:Uncharacterized protein n=1 Tax=Fictibacillus halophilus TaxID=1610490 RepID=A0ABV2LF38_9BACL|nr:hypothetical protein [Fictibacillus halophilus]